MNNQEVKRVDIKKDRTTLLIDPRGKEHINILLRHDADFSSTEIELNQNHIITLIDFLADNGYLDMYN